MVSGISSQQQFQPNAAMEAMRTKMESFRSGKTTLSKDDLNDMVSKMTENGKTAPEDLKQILSNYESIDADGDGGLNFDEITSYADENNIKLGGPFSKEGPQGPPPGGGPGGPPPGGGQGSETQGSTSSSNDITSTLLENLQDLINSYLKTDSSETTSNNFTIYT